MDDATVLDPPECPACSATMAAWPVSPGCVLWRCPGCGHIDRDLRLAPARARAEEYGGDPAADRVRLALTVRRIRHRAAGADRGSVLEIGAGSGHLAGHLADRASTVTAVDVHAPAGATDPRVRHLVGRLEDVDLPEGAFDLVVGIHVLEHVADVGATLAHARRLLAPGGLGYFITPNADCVALRTFGADWWMLEDPTHVRFLSPRSAELMARAAGFAVVDTRRLLADSLACDGATVARRIRRDISPRGVLDHRSTGVLAAAVLPASLVLRAASPGWRPAMEMVLR